TTHQPAQRFGTGDNNGCVLLKELKKALLARHECLKPAEHIDVPPRVGAHNLPCLGSDPATRVHMSSDQQAGEWRTSSPKRLLPRPKAARRDYPLLEPLTRKSI